MSYTKTIHISELNHIRLKLHSVLKESTIEQELDLILNKELENIGKEIKNIVESEE